MCRSTLKEGVTAATPAQDRSESEEGAPGTAAGGEDNTYSPDMGEAKVEWGEEREREESKE